MKRCLLTSQGSTGDIFPMIAVGAALREAGYTVAFATFPAFQKEIERAGLEFVSLPPDWQKEDLSRIMQGMYDHRGPARQLIYLYRTMGPHLPGVLKVLQPRVEEADVVLSSYLFPLGAFIPEFLRGKVYAVMAFAPNTVPCVDIPPDGVPVFRLAPTWLRKGWAQFMWKVADVAMNRWITKALRKSGGMPPDWKMRGFFKNPAPKVLVGVTPLLQQGTPQDPERYVFTGYCRWQNAADPELLEKVEAFCANEEVPVVTFGSMVNEDPEETMGRFLRHWPIDRKVILQTGWSGFRLPTPQPHILLVGPANHDALFQRASLVVHHGGAGTTASALHAGRPQIIVPHIADQPFFASEMERLGVGLTLPKDRWPENLASAVAQVQGESRYAEKAKAIAGVLSKARGPQEVVRVLEEMSLKRS